MFSHFGRLFLTGLIVLLPVTLSVYLLYWLGTASEQLFGRVAGRILPHTWYVPGTGLLLMIGLIMLVGLFMQSKHVSRLWRWIDHRLLSIPVFKTLYAGLRDLMDFVSKSSNQRPETVVSVQLAEDISVLGFVTRADLRDLFGDQERSDRIAVYLPMSFQIGGYTVFIPKSKISPVNIDVEKALRFTVTGGMASTDEVITTR